MTRIRHRAVTCAVLLAAAGYGLASRGPTSLRAQYRRRAASALREPSSRTVVTEADLAHLPVPIATYVRRSGALGQPRVVSFRARVHGRIRAGATAPWMTFTGEQLNTYGPRPSRVFFMKARMLGLPVDVLHVFAGPTASMRVRLCSLVPMVSAAGPDLRRAETVTVFNDLCILAPAALVDAAVVWDAVDDHHVLGTFTLGAHTVSAVLTFDDGRLVDFVSDDRLRASPDGSSFAAQRWSTPVRDVRSIDGRRLPTHGEGRWHAPDPEGEFTYIEFGVDDISYNPRAPVRGTVRGRRRSARAGS